jgi:hypothetical protein
MERCSLQLDRGDRENYSRLVSLVQSLVPPEGSVFAVPSDAEIYFLANRRNPFRFFNSALGIRTADDLAATLDVLVHHPPMVVTYRPGDKYDTAALHKLMEHVRTAYDRLDTIGGIEVYRLRPPA